MLETMRDLNNAQLFWGSFLHESAQTVLLICIAYVTSVESRFTVCGWIHSLTEYSVRMQSLIAWLNG